MSIFHILHLQPTAFVKKKLPVFPINKCHEINAATRFCVQSGQ